MEKAEEEFWGSLCEYAKTAFRDPEFRCGCVHWSNTGVTFLITQKAGQVKILEFHGGEIKTVFPPVNDELDRCLDVCVFAIEHRQEYFDGGFQTPDEYLQFCIYEVTGSGFVKSASKT